MEEKQNIAAEKANRAEQQPVSPAEKSHTHYANKQKYIVIAGIAIVALSLIGSVFYIMGAINKTRELSAYKENPPTIQTRIQQEPTQASVQISQEEQELEAIDTGDPSRDLESLEKDLTDLE